VAGLSRRLVSEKIRGEVGAVGKEKKRKRKDESFLQKRGIGEEAKCKFVVQVRQKKKRDGKEG